ncbi:MAG TPA: hypothetical protein VNJ01_01155 [Bacteriovoracaceae bacterium]|nr:hypothetical protein [Bacteriovoracaceae bacterium]
MKMIRFLALAVFLIPTTWAASNAVLEENLYYDYQKSILSAENTTQKSFNGFSSFEQGLYVDALWHLVEENSPQAMESLETLNTIHYDLLQRLRIGILRIKYKRSKKLPLSLNRELMNLLKQPVAQTNIVYTIAAYEEDLLKAGHSKLIGLAKKHPQYLDVSQSEVRKDLLTKDIIGDLFNNSPEISEYMNGEYVKSVKIFMFCRENRLYPCLMVMRDSFGQVVRKNNGSIWTHKALASSSKGLPSYTTNGDTPAGIHTIDSVMPLADQPLAFGQFRRMILNAVPKSSNETLLKSLLPPSSHNSNWWKPSTVARDIGRGLFRIHGSGRLNPDSTTPYFPFNRTSGCVAQSENTYGGVTYQDQRVLLDAVMEALVLKPQYDNELKIKGILYMVELDDQKTAVTREDLVLKGIE